MSLPYGHKLFGPRSVENQAPVSRQVFSGSKMVMRLLLAGGLLVAMCLFYIWSRIQIVQISYEINKHQSEQEELIDQNKNLRMELELMKSAQRISEFATQKINMSEPRLDQILRVRQNAR